MRRKSIKDFEDVRDYLSDNGFIYSGCYYCLNNGGCGGVEAAAKCKRNVKTVHCIPVSEIPECLMYPRKSIIHWFGKILVFALNVVVSLHLIVGK